METNRINRKKMPPFSRVGVLNLVRELKIDRGVHALLPEGQYMIFSPYVNYIPISYLGIIRDKSSNNINSAEEYINFDEPTSFGKMGVSHQREESFSTNQFFLETTGRAIRKSMGSFTLIHDNKAHIIACILPENLIYQKLHILRRGTIDMSKVIILIDRELDNTSFRPTSLRTLYRTQLLPEIVNTSCSVFKVPLKFIMDNCFYKENIVPINIVERRKFKEDVMESFGQSTGTPLVSLVEQVLIAGHNIVQGSVGHTHSIPVYEDAPRVVTR